jgi:flagellar assembly factor FliW
MKIMSTRAGAVEVDEREVINFPEGLVGIPFWQSAVLLPIPEVAELCWLQAVDDPDAAFLLLKVGDYFPQYDENLARACAELPDGAVYSIVRVPQDDLSRATTNLMGPVIIDLSAATGKQVVLHDSGYDLRQPLFGS